MATNEALTEPEIILRALLSGGPRCSRDVLAQMAGRGMTPKQVRRAREKQGVVVQRSGSGAGMRSTWELPSGAIRAQDHRQSTHAPARARDQQIPTGVRVPTHAQPAVLGTTLAHAAKTSGSNDLLAIPSDAELRRRDARIDAFVQRGVPRGEAQATADKLLQADRENRHAYGSCAQCHWWGTGECRDIRPALEIHVCQRRRVETP